jgi:hypothetical protein
MIIQCRAALAAQEFEMPASTGSDRLKAALVASSRLNLGVTDAAA